ncbi:MAG TPA: HAMP domain-containing sensor histidine kinase [Sedimentisphaerales bacterium]|jgi:signal transduction histidine kinase|nr:HAMP domain-containing sensor histidine kinase [Sedimentisphaerales bacterium]HNU30963.1 HAMP domain-containing sensor histidine kinase [Sedimentisphaerales bacterium]
MYRRLVILSVIILAALCALGALGYHAVDKWSQGLEGARLGEFAEVAEQIRQDVKRKLDEFVQVEQQRKYTDYLYSHVPENVVVAQQAPVLRSPLGGQLSNSYAYGYFQIEPDGAVVSPYYPGRSPPSDVNDDLNRAVRNQYSNVVDNVLPSISLRSGALEVSAPESNAAERNEAAAAAVLTKDEAVAQVPTARKGIPDARSARSQAYPIESLKQKAQDTQVYRQQRSIMASNFQATNSDSQQLGQIAQVTVPQVQTVPVDEIRRSLAGSQPPAAQQAEQTVQPAPTEIPGYGQLAETSGDRQGPTALASDTVQIRIEPFVPLVVRDPNRTQSIFGGQVFLLRHVQIENRHLLQGFQLDEPKLVTEVEESARSFIRDGMSFELPQVRKANGQSASDELEPAYAAVLDFGFGDLVLNLMEIDPAWITRRIGDLRHLYFAILATVVAAVGLALVSLWHNVRAQVALARKKDDFISAVSHELRTPLTSIRMYTEMLEKNWVKSQDKVAEYYRTMRQESERLSRLVENVLDFARLQKGRKKYAFRLGNIDAGVAGVVEMMRPYAEQHGFTIRADLAAGQTLFDKDAVTQIVVNLVDNAVKYARGAADKTIAVRTRSEPGATIIEVEDHGPGIPSHLRRKVFEQFYRCEEDVPRADPQPNQASGTGMGLGLTLVKHFAEAHGGYVEIDPAQPTGAILRVALALENQPTS